MTAEVICYRTRSAVRDVGKALGLSLDRVDTLAKNVEGYHHEPRLDQRCRDAGIDPDSDGLAPFSIQKSTRSWSIWISAGRAIGL